MGRKAVQSDGGITAIEGREEYSLSPVLSTLVVA